MKNIVSPKFDAELIKSNEILERAEELASIGSFEVNLSKLESWGSSRVKALAGSISVVATPNHGARFEIRIHV